MARLEIHQRKSSIGEKADAKRTLVALGLRRTGATVAQEDSPVLRGMLRRVAHLVDVKPLGGGGTKSERATALLGRVSSGEAGEPLGERGKK